MPFPEDGHENIERLLGRLIEKSDRADNDRAAFRSETSAGLGGIQQQLNGLAGLPGIFALHEQQDQQRHIDNTSRLSGIETRLGSLEAARAEHAGVRKGVGLGIAVASAAGGGGLFAIITTLFKKWGWL